MCVGGVSAQSHRSAKTVIKGGVIPMPDTTRVAKTDTLIVGKRAQKAARKAAAAAAAQIAAQEAAKTAAGTTKKGATRAPKKLSKKAQKALLQAKNSHTHGATLQDLLYREAPTEISDTTARDTTAMDSLATDTTARTMPLAMDTIPKHIRRGLFGDSMSLSKVCWISTVLPGYGQIYNKQYWKLPILYATVGTSLALYFHESSKYRPLKAQYNSLIAVSPSRTPELDRVQAQMIRSNTRRQAFLLTSIASYIFFIGDAAVNYSTNNVSNVKKATTLATICPGAGQIYNRSYWKVPFVIGGFASMIYCIDWNNRGFQRFKKAYTLRADFDTNPDKYPDGSTDEFKGRYSTSFLKNLKDSYRRNRDLCIIITAGLYILQIVDAHVDAHLKDYDISDDLSLNIEPMVNYEYVPTLQGHRPMYGFNVSLKF